MIIIIGLVILIAAVIAAVAGVLANSGHAHALPAHSFAVLSYHVTGSTGTLFLYGVVVGAIGLLGLSMLLAGARRTSRRGRAARRGLKQSQQETAAAAQARDDLIDQRDTARTYTASTLGSGPADGANGQRPADGQRGRSWPFGRRASSRQAAPQQAALQQAAAPQEPPAEQPGPVDPAGVPAPTANTSHP